jgi:hypothetical protein
VLIPVDRHKISRGYVLAKKPEGITGDVLFVLQFNGKYSCSGHNRRQPVILSEM